MRMKSFNEITASLRGAQSRQPTEDTEALAQKLLDQGIASTMMEAREQAKSMVKTEKNVNVEFSEKKEELTKYNDPRNNPTYNPHRAAVADEMRKRAMENKPIKILDEFQTPGYEAKNGSQGLPRAVIRQKKPEE